MAHHYTGQNIWSLMTNVRNSFRISSKEWSRAIAKAIALELMDPADVEVELARPQTAFLSVGNRLYRLDCVDEIPTPVKALPALRRNVMESAKTEAQALITAAQEKKARLELEGTTIVANANIRAAQIVNSHRKLMSETAMMPPQWLRDSGYPIRRNRNDDSTFRHLEVGLPITVTIREVQYGKKFWRHQAPEDETLPSLNVRVWSPLDRSHNAYDNLNHCLAMDDYCIKLPHCTDHSCFVIANCPDRINSRTELEHWRADIERAMSGINLNSPLLNPNGWDKRLLDILPPVLKSALATKEARQNWVRILSDLPSDPAPRPATFTSATTVTQPLVVPEEEEE